MRSWNSKNENFWDFFPLGSLPKARKAAPVRWIFVNPSQLFREPKRFTKERLLDDASWLVAAWLNFCVEIWVFFENFVLMVSVFGMNLGTI